ncbi:MAG: hypothetical protein MI975_02505 [Cytophagales bacterium]|nr:hypothetical protein [Cytophagales bacterium]
MRKKVSGLSILFFPITFVCFGQEKSVSFSEVLQRYWNLEQLAVLPKSGEQNGMISSYDRNSMYDLEQNKYLNWAANKDGEGFVREEGDYFVLAHIKGTGFINRIWSAKPEKGVVIFEIDGKEVLSLPAAHVFDGKHELSIS